MNQSLRPMFEEQLRDLYSAENQLIKALQKVALKATTDILRDLVETHVEETKEQIRRLESIAYDLNMSLSGKKCRAMEGILEEGGEVFEKENSVTTDVQLVALAQRIGHFEISTYGTAAAVADELGHRKIAGTLRLSLEEELATDESLTEICDVALFPQLESVDEVFVRTFDLQESRR